MGAGEGLRVDYLGFSGGLEARMSYTRGFVVEYQYQGAGIGIV